MNLLGKMLIFSCTYLDGFFDHLPLNERHKFLSNIKLFLTSFSDNLWESVQEGNYHNLLQINISCCSNN